MSIFTLTRIKPEKEAGSSNPISTLSQPYVDTYETTVRTPPRPGGGDTGAANGDPAGVPPVTPEQIRRLFPNASASTLQANDHHSRPARVPDAKPEPAIRKALERAAQGEEASRPRAVGRVTVRIVGHRVRLQDADNHAGGCKALIDQLRYSGLIANDDPETIQLETGQVRVKSFTEEKTVIEITYAA